MDTNRELYDGLLQRYKEIGVAGVAANNISLVDPALEPERPSSPNLPLNLIVALFGGLAVAGAIVFGLEQFEEGIRDPAQVSQVTGLPLLGVIRRPPAMTMFLRKCAIPNRTSPRPI